jgi:hypothetical protein
LLGEPVAPLGERRKRGRSKAAALIIKRIRQPLVMKARRRHGTLRRQPEIDDVG